MLRLLPDFWGGHVDHEGQHWFCCSLDLNAGLLRTRRDSIVLIGDALSAEENLGSEFYTCQFFFNVYVP